MANKPKQRSKQHVPEGIVVIKATFNNTIITLTDTSGNTIAQSSAGALGYKGSRKSTPHAAKEAADNVAKRGKDAGLKLVFIRVNGPGSGRESAIRAFGENAIEVKEIKDITPIPHNGTRPRKKRRI